MPEPKWVKAWADRAGKDPGDKALVNDPDLRRALGAVIDDVNKSLSGLERVRRFVITPDAFSVDNGQLTPTLKLRRHVITAAYRPQLEALYATA